MTRNPRSFGLGGATNLALLAPVREGLAPGFEPISYVERLRRLFDAMHASRRNARESELRRSVFPDPIGRFGIISHFRYALVPPDVAHSDRWHLSLNVGFDGGWEPYMRVIYRDIGPLLDALLCHCEGYPGSRTSDFDSYCRWVRAAEFDAGIHYTDSAATLGDQRYLASVERLQREAATPREADAAIAAHAEAGEVAAMQAGVARAAADPAAHLPLHLRTLKGLYRLTAYWDGADGAILLRFAKLVLKGFEDTLATLDETGHSPLGPVLALVADEIAWLRSAPDDPQPPAPRLTWEPARLQAAVLGSGVAATHGALVLCRVVDPERACAHLASLAPLCAAPVAAGTVQHHVALTSAGLEALGVHADRLDRLPREFRDGMETRAGILGDVRANHPDHWRRPLRRGVDPARGDRIDLAVVHVVVVLRTVDASPDHALLPIVARAATAVGAAGTGLAVLAVEATRSRTAERDGREHFGFADGKSQPEVVATGDPDPARRHQVRPGEIALGHRNDRDDARFPPAADALLDDGSFLVVRKLRQRLDHLAEAPGLKGLGAKARADVLARMMGCRADGRPLVATGAGGDNDFDFAGKDGAQCPFASHVRRANPRDGRPALPRILRRGMGYGPKSDAGLGEDRGTVFMAYCGSIAEQFEVVQRWVAGGNSSGVGSVQSDPFLGVPQDGESRVFRWLDGARTRRVDLGTKPFVELEWGLYLFAPSLDALRRLAGFRAPPPRTWPQTDVPSELDRWRGRLEDRDNGRRAWRDVRAAGGVCAAPGYGTLVGSAAEVFAALQDESRVSVHGFGVRMDATVGRNHLGMDGADHAAVGAAVNPVVADVDEATAFAAAATVVAGVLQRAGATAQASPFVPRHADGRLRCPVDLMQLSETVVALLAKAWFGLPDGVNMVGGGRLPDPDIAAVPRCPGHIIGPSRMIFGTHPRDRVVAEGVRNGPAVLAAVKASPVAGALTLQMTPQLDALGQAHGPDLVARSVAGLLLGFAPTVHGNFLTVMKNWIERGTLWTLQQDLADRTLAGAPPFEAARDALCRPMLDAMQSEPVPPMVWREPVTGGRPDPAAPPVVLGLASAIDDLDPVADRARRDALLFGGDYFAADPALRGVHACPGRRMGVGVMLAMAAGLLNAGTLRPTGSPVLLMLTPKTPVPAAPPPPVTPTTSPAPAMPTSSPAPAPAAAP